MNIIEYMKKKRLTQRECAKLLGTDEAQLSRYVNGKARPQLAIAARYAEKTDGEVDALSWLTIKAR